MCFGMKLHEGYIDAIAKYVKKLKVKVKFSFINFQKNYQKQLNY